jgi:2-methylcitrate dehydratase PrpD
MRPSSGNAIHEIRIEGSEVHRMLAEPSDRKRAPQTAIDAKFSLPFTVATALVAGGVDLDSFAEGGLRNEQVLQLARRASFALRPDWGIDQTVSGAVQITLADGRVLRQEVLDPRGSPARPLTDQQLLAKFVDCAGRARKPLAPGPATDLALRILDLINDADAGATLAT